jgi:hypothetical protein
VKIGFISLGCAKNRVDSEIMMGLLKEQGHLIVDRLEYADMVIINTCGFLTEAKEEAITKAIKDRTSFRNGLCWDLSFFFIRVGFLFTFFFFVVGIYCLPRDIFSFILERQI